MKNKKGFTLIELLAVLVVLAILALISIPITIRIINQARENSYKRSIANYGKAFENEIAINNLNSPENEYKDLSEYDVDNIYSGNRIQCDLVNSTIEKGNIVLRYCKVVDESKKRLSKYKYKYEKGIVTIDDEYDIGTIVKVNNVEFYVIKDSKKEDDYVVALKKEKVSVEEIESVGGDHLNKYVSYGRGVAYAGYPDGYHVEGVAYYTSETCGYPAGSVIETGCSNVYETSDVRYIIDAWADKYFNDDQLKRVDGYKARLISIKDLEGLGFGSINSHFVIAPPTVPDWLFTMDYYIMPPYPSDVSVDRIMQVTRRTLGSNHPHGLTLLRPVINIYKSAIED